MKFRLLVSSVVGLALSFPSGLAAAPPDQVTPVIATAEELRSFAGVWRGHVDSADGRFAGEVEFRFAPGGDAVIRTRSTPSRILWVRLARSRVSGALEPYFDTARGADVYTTFDAMLHGTTLSGVLHERVGMRWKQSATWTVERMAGSD